MQSYTKSQDFALVVLRLIVAAIFLQAAYVKIPFWSAVPEGMTVGMANLMKFLSIVEPLGAVAVLFGFLTRYAASGLSIVLLGAIFVLQFMLKVGFSTPTGPGWSFPLVVLVSCIILFAFGPGRFSLDARRRKIV